MAEAVNSHLWSVPGFLQSDLTNDFHVDDIEPRPAIAHDRRLVGGSLGPVVESDDANPARGEASLLDRVKNAPAEADTAEIRSLARLGIIARGHDVSARRKPIVELLGGANGRAKRQP